MVTGSSAGMGWATGRGCVPGKRVAGTEVTGGVRKGVRGALGMGAALANGRGAAIGIGAGVEGATGVNGFVTCV